jgi:hypothetical protein
MRAGEALRAMSVDEGLSVREAVEWCGTGITVREVVCPAFSGRLNCVISCCELRV